MFRVPTFIPYNRLIPTRCYASIASTRKEVCTYIPVLEDNYGMSLFQVSHVSLARWITSVQSVALFPFRGGFNYHDAELRNTT